MERTLDISREELVREFRKALQVSDAGFDQNALSVDEIADLLSLSRSRARKAVSAAIQAGRIERVQKRIHTKDGRYAPVPAYRIKNE